MSSLPPLYASWIQEALGDLPEETRATCGSCPMQSAEEADAVPRFPLKCCGTYEPNLPSFVVGGILSDPSRARAHEVIAERVRSRRGATPIGLSRSLRYDLKRRAARERFGEAPDLACSYYVPEEGGLCGIWQDRGAVCATWFCRHLRGVAGVRLWNAVRDLLLRVESSLTVWCLLELAPDDAPFAALLDETGAPRWPSEGSMAGFIHPDGSIEGATAARLWGSWLGREAAYYQACARRVLKLDWSSVRAIGGMPLVVAERKAQSLLAGLGKPIGTGPLRLARLDTSHAVEELGDRVVLRALESGFDPLVMPAPAFAALAGHSARSAAGWAATLAERGLAWEGDAVQRLIDHNVLEPASAEAGSAPLEIDSRDRMYFEPAAPHASQTSWTPEGTALLVVKCGAREITFDEPLLLEFGRVLFDHRAGFLVVDARSWVPALAIPRVDQMLRALVDAGVLRHERELESGKGVSA